MCLALPGKVLAINEETERAAGAVDQVKVDVSLALVEDIELGDYVLIHVGYALNKLSEEEARSTLQLFAEAGLTEQIQ